MTDYWFIQLGPNYGGQAAVRISWDNEQLLPHELSVEYKTATDNTGIKPAVEHGGSYEGKKTSIFFTSCDLKKVQFHINHFISYDDNDASGTLWFVIPLNCYIIQITTCLL